MPKIPEMPTYDNFAVQAKPLGADVRQQRDTSPGLFEGNARQVGQLGNALNNVGQGVGEIVGQMQDQDNVAKVQAASAAYGEKLFEFTNEAKNSRVGVAAEGVTKDFEQWHDQTVTEIANGLGNDAQRRAFQVQAMKSRAMSRVDFGDFELTQKRKTQKATFDATLETERNLGAIAPTEGMALIRKENIVNNIHAFAAVQQLPDVARQAIVDEQLAGFHAARVGQLVDKDYASAAAYYEANKGEIVDPKTRLAIEGTLKAGGLKKLAQGFADQVQALNVSESDALKVARQKYSGEEEDAVVGEIKVRFSEQTQARERAQRDASDQAWKTFSQRGRLSDIPAPTLAAMDGKDVEALKAHARALAEGRQAKTDPGTYYDLRKLAASDPASFQSLDLRRYLDRLSPGDFKDFAKLQADGKGIKDAATLDAQLSNMHDQLGWGSNDREKKGTFDRAVTNAINEEQATRGKALNYEERQKIIDRMTVEGEVLSGHWYKADPNKRFYEVAGTPEQAKFAPTIPAGDRKTIVDRFKAKKGRNPTEAEIAQTFRTWRGL